MKQILSSMKIINENTKSNNKSNLIVLHGLLGFSRNFYSICKSQPISSKVNSYLLDLRNHGNSFHSPIMSLSSMASDLKNYINENQIEDTFIMGHSLGGRILLEFLTKYSDYHERIKGAIIVDITPKIASSGNDFIFKLIGDLNKINLNNEYDKIREEIMIKCNNDKAFFSFILANLKKQEDKKYKWNFNIETIYENYEKNVAVNIEPVGKKFNGNFLGIFGSNSKYYNKGGIQSFNGFIDNFDSKSMCNFVQDAGHWVHADKPHQFIQIISDFIDKHHKN